MRSRASLTAVSALGLLAAVGCENHQSFIVLTLLSTGAAIPDVKTVAVTVTDAQGTQMVTLSYPGKGSTIGSATTGGADGGASDAGGSGPPVTLSVSFDSDRRGLVKFAVEASDGLGCRIASGSSEATIFRGDIGTVTVLLRPHAPQCGPPDAAADRPDATDGSSDGAETGFPGCDPAMASTCGPGKTCYVDCNAGAGVCEPAGPAGPGEACPMDTGSCQQGTQCFQYLSAPDQCNTRVCLKFCKTDGDCTSATGVGLGPGSLCKGPVVCKGVLTGHRTCTFGCDPRAVQTGCPTGLSCFLIDEHDQVDCRCRPATAVKAEGDTCANFAECSPGLICSGMATNPQQRCRRLCKVGGTDCTPGQTCTMLLNDMIYGVCL